MERIFKFLTKSGKDCTEVARNKSYLIAQHKDDDDAIETETIIDYTPFVVTPTVKDKIRKILEKNGIDNMVVESLLR